MSTTADPGPWGSQVKGRGRGRRTALVLVLVVALLAGAVVAVASALYLRADDALTQVPVEGLDEDEAEDDPETPSRKHFLVVGSDSRQDIEEHTDDIALGDQEEQQSDVLMYVTLPEDREDVSIVSIPRDIVVEWDGREQRISHTFEEGADALVAAVQQRLGLPVHHYAQVNFDGFIEAVDTLGGVDICLENDLVDPNAGADLRAGCQRLSPPDALAFVRSRQGERSDYERIERQQRFLRAAIEELTQRRVLADVPQLFDLVQDVLGNITTDDALGLTDMLGLAEELSGAVDRDLPMVSVPSYPDTLGEGMVMRIYVPGARALFDAVVEGRPVPNQGTREQRQDISVALWSGGRVEELEIVGSVLHFGGIGSHGVAGLGPEEFDADGTTTVYFKAGDTEPAGHVAALLGAPIELLPPSVDIPAGYDVIVAVGRDASTPGEVLGTSMPGTDSADRFGGEF